MQFHLQRSRLCLRARPRSPQLSINTPPTVTFVDHQMVQLGPVSPVVKYQLEPVLVDQIHRGLFTICALRGREERVECDAEGVMHHLRDETGYERTADGQCGVRVDLDEVDFEVLVDHHIEA